MNPPLEKQKISFLKRADITDFLEDEAVVIPSGGGTHTIEDILNTDNLNAYECEIEGKRVILLGFEPKQ